MTERQAKMAEMRAAGAVLEEIGAAFGVTRERARQLLKKAGVEGRLPKVVKPITPERFGWLCKRWLWAAGYYRCTMCHQWVEKKVFPCGQVAQRCNDCNNVQAKEWRLENLERANETRRRFMQGEKYKAWKKRYEADPEQKQRRRDYVRKRVGSNVPLGSPALTKEEVLARAREGLMRKKGLQP